MCHVFRGAYGNGSFFQSKLLEGKGPCYSTETRAFVNTGGSRGGPINYVSLSGYGPNINIWRDPRFGRGSEVPSEDPFLSGSYGSEMVQGMQEEDPQGRPKMIAMLKHFTSYSRETDRGSDTYNISQHDFFEAYLAQYEIAFKDGKASGAMCSYAGVNGAPSCANGYLLNDILRKRWGRSDALVSTDCGAVSNLRHKPVNASSDEAAAAMAINNGTDIEMGTTLFFENLEKAVADGLINKSTVEAAARRSLRVQFAAGRFDPVGTTASNPWAHLGTESINSTAHQQVLREAALQSFVLLKNDGVLPLKRGGKVAVVGPQVFATGGLYSDYANGPPDTITIAQAIALVNSDGVTTSAIGVDVSGNSSEHPTGPCTDTSKVHGAACISAALEVVEHADVVVLVLGIDGTIDREGLDRVDTALPGLQEPFAHLVLGKGKPVVLVLAGRGVSAIDNLTTGPAAVVQAFAPGHSAAALAESVFGLENRWGKLPVTMYPHNYIREQSMTNYDMSQAPGRTYKYYTGKPLYEFGFGLSLTTFELECHAVNNSDIAPSLYIGDAAEAAAAEARRQPRATPVTTVTCEVKSTGNMTGDEVVMVYHVVSGVVYWNSP